MQIRMTFLLVGGQEVHSQWINMSESELNEIKEFLKESMKSSEGGYLTLDSFVDNTGQTVEHLFRLDNVAGIRITHG